MFISEAVDPYKYRSICMSFPDCIQVIACDQVADIIGVSLRFRKHPFRWDIWSPAFGVLLPIFVHFTGDYLPHLFPFLSCYIGADVVETAHLPRVLCHSVHALAVEIRLVICASETAYGHVAEGIEGRGISLL